MWIHESIGMFIKGRKKGVKKGIEKIVHDFWIPKRMLEIDEKKSNEPNKNHQVQRLGNKSRNRNNEKKNRKLR